jgi:Domain of Unknown Function (DUF928)
MKFSTLTMLLMLTFISGLAPVDVAAADAADASAKKKPASIAYQPPLRGAPLSRVGGGTRSIRAADLQIEVLAPEHTGLTLQAQPVFYWYSSRAIAVPVEFAIVKPNVPEPVLEVTLKGPFEPGIHAVDLRAYGLKLDAETDYEWFVSVIFDPKQRSNDVTAGAGIRQIGADDGIRTALKPATAQGADYAQAGVWYDAIASLSANIAARPTDPTPREQRAALLQQVGLTDAAAAAP